MKKRFLAIFIVVMMLFSQITVFASVPDSSTTSINPEDKLTDELKEVMSNTPDGEYIPIYIWLNDEYSESLIYMRLSNKLGTTITSETESKYIDDCIAEKTSAFENEISKFKKNETETFDEIFAKMNSNNQINAFRVVFNDAEDVHNDIQIKLQANKSYEDIISSVEKERFLSLWRKEISKINQEINNNFINCINSEKCINILIDSSLTYVQLDCEKTYIEEIACIYSVLKIGYNQPLTISEAVETSNEISIASYDVLENINQMNRFSNLDYSGYGVKIGVIEPDNFYDITNPHLENKNIIVVEGGTTIGETTASDHPTAMMSMISGQSINGYSGVAPDATVYFAGGATDSDIIRQYMYTLVVEKNVSILNMSIGIDGYSSYGDFDNYIDCFIEQYRTVVVIAAGNTNWRIQRPGNAYNAITVGNVSNEVEDGKFVMNSSVSGYDEYDSDYTNKPDISAPGTNITMYKNNDGVIELTNYGTGTSASTAIVSGTIALLCEANPELVGKPDAIKAILLNSANDLVSETNNGIVSTVKVLADSDIEAESLVRERSGCGMLNIEGALSLATSNILYRYSIPANSTLDEATIVVDEFFFAANKTIEATLIFEKSYHTIPNSTDNIKTNFDIEIYNSSGTKIVWTTSTANNVETISVTFPRSDYYTFKIVCNKLDADNTTISMIDGDGNTLAHQSHNEIYISFLLSCGCDLPSANISYCNEQGHDITCSNCGFLCMEEHMHATETQYLSGVTVTYDVYYKIRQFNNDCNDIICYYDAYPKLTPTNPENTAIYIQDMSYTEFQVYKRWDMLNYDILIISPNNEVTELRSTVYINVYYETRECEFDTPY